MGHGWTETYWARADEVGELPEVPGLYAWYAVPNPGRWDYVAGPDEEDEVAMDRFIDLLRRHSEKLEPPGIRLNGFGAFASSWTGDLSDETLRSLILPGGHESLPHLLATTLGEERGRRFLAWGVVRAAPMLAAPIYIGVTESIRQRISDHLYWLNRALQRERSEGTVPEAWVNGHFGARAVSAGFNQATLYLAIVPAELSEDAAEIRTWCEGLEWLLNRWYRPVLGRY